MEDIFILNLDYFLVAFVVDFEKNCHPVENTTLLTARTDQNYNMHITY